MNKFFTVLLLCSAFIAVSASEKEVIRVNDEFHRKMLTLDLNGALALTHPEFTGKTTAGMELNYAIIQRTVMLYQMMDKLDRPDVTLTEFIEFGVLSQGQVMTPQMRQQVKAMENTEEGKQKLALMKQFLRETRSKQVQMKAAAATAWAQHKVISCKVSGNNAVLVFEMPAADSADIEKTTAEWVKVDGKWLLKKSVTEKSQKK